MSLYLNMSILLNHKFAFYTKETVDSLQRKKNTFTAPRWPIGGGIDFYYTGLKQFSKQIFEIKTL